MTLKPSYEELEAQIAELEKLITSAGSPSDDEKAHKALKESESRFQLLTSMSPAGIYQTDSQGNCIYANAACLAMTGLTLEEMLGQGWLKGLHSEDRQTIRDAWYQTVQSKGHWEQEYRIQNANGQVTWVYGLANPLYADKDQIEGYLGVNIDITDRIAAQQALADSENLHRTTIENISDTVIITDEQGAFTYICPNTHLIFGLSPDQVKNLGNIFALLGGPLVDPQDLDTQTEIRNIERSIVDVDGNEHNLIINVKRVCIQKGRLLYTCRDITDRKQVEAERQRLMSAIEQVAEAIVITDASGDILYVNPAFERNTGYSRQEALGQNPRLVKSGRHDQNFYRQMWETITHGRTWNGRMVNKRKDGTLFNEECTISPVFDGSGTIANFVAVKRDITADIVLQDRIRQSQKLEAIGTLAGGIAHDFNNILFPLIGFTEMLREDLPQDSPLQDHVDEILHAALRSRELVRQILIFSRQADQKIKPIRLHIIVKEALKLIRASVPTTIKIEQKIDSNCGVVLSDPTQIHQIVMNLCTNAFHAMEDNGGTLSVMLSQVHAASDSSDLPGMPAGEYACLSFADTGIGIDKDLIERIFDPYFTTKDREKGTGLGLSVVQGIVKTYGGDIRISSEPGVGTHIKVYLPIMERYPEKHSWGESETIAGGNEKILLVDDEKAILRTSKKMLERLGYQVAERDNSTDALNAFRNNPDAFDLVITDMTMPDMTGDRLAVEIMALKPDVPVIICTGFSGKIDQEKARNIGVKGLLMKPIIQSEMARMVRKALDESVHRKLR